MLSLLCKMGKPVGNEFETLRLKPVNPHPALPFVREQARGLKDLEVSRGGLPGVLEHCRDVAGGHRAPVKVNRQQHAPPRCVR